MNDRQGLMIGEINSMEGSTSTDKGNGISVLKFKTKKTTTKNYNAILGNAPKKSLKPSTTKTAGGPAAPPVVVTAPEPSPAPVSQNAPVPTTTTATTLTSEHAAAPSFVPQSQQQYQYASQQQDQQQQFYNQQQQQLVQMQMQQQMMMNQAMTYQQPQDVLTLHQQQAQQIALLQQQLEAMKVQQEQLLAAQQSPALAPQAPPVAASGGGSYQQQAPPKKPSSVWNKPKTWSKQDVRGRGDEAGGYSDDDGESDSLDGFVTKSDKQGQMYRDMNTEEGRAALEKELFGTEKHMKAGIDFAKYDSIPVEASGNGIPEPITSFAEANFCKPLMDNIERARYTRPTPIQKHAIPMAMLGRDIMACAQTGSGKTAAFLFPIINTILTKGRRNNRRSRMCLPEALVLAPTRELASQIHEEAMRFTYQTEARVVVVYGGTDIRMQMDELSRGCSIIVATPGRLEDLVIRRRIGLSNVKHLVLDEADRMLDLGFEPQIRKIVQDYDMPQEDMSGPNGRQTAMFSATFPVNIQQLAGDFMADYIFVTVGRVGSTNMSIEQRCLWVEDDDKTFKIVELLNEIPGLTLIFVETKRTADILHHELFQKQGVRTASIHGDRSQREREAALWEFSTGRVSVLVATEVAARGLDIPDVKHVINYDLPQEIDSYVHRIGRTGRAGNKGTATSLINEKNLQIAGDLVRVLQETQQKVPSWLEGLANQASLGKRGGRRGRGGRGGKNFGSRDYRRETAGQKVPNTTTTYDAAPKTQQPSNNKNDSKPPPSSNASTTSGGGGGRGKGRGGRGSRRGGKRGGRGRGGKSKGNNQGGPPPTTDAW